MRKYQLLSISAILLFTAIISACKKDTKLQTVTNVDATMRNTGDPAADGCGWFILIDNEKKSYQPINLNDTYKQNNAKVTVSYVILNTKSYCGQVGVGPGNEQIEIKSITFK